MDNPAVDAAVIAVVPDQQPRYLLDVWKLLQCHFVEEAAN